MFQIPCPLCNSINSNYSFLLNNWTIVDCQQCGFEFVNPRPSRDEIEKMYSDTNNTIVAQVHQSYYKTGHNQDQKHYRKELKSIIRLLPEYNISPKLLDFGCGDGSFLSAACSKGMDVYGYDIGSWNIDMIQDDELKQKIYIGNFKEAPYENGFFDVIYSHAVFEHLYNPKIVLTQLSKKLKRNGLLMITGIPNVKSLFINLGIDSFDGNVPLIHLNYFSKNTLSDLLSNTGFEILKIRTWGVPLRLSLWKETIKEGDDMVVWDDKILKGPMVKLLKKMKLFPITKKSINAVLNLINGGAVIDIIGRKISE